MDNIHKLISKGFYYFLVFKFGFPPPAPKTISCLQSILYLPTSQHNLPYKIKIPTTPTQLFMHPTTYKPKTQTSPQTAKEKQPKTCSPRASLFFLLV